MAATPTDVQYWLNRAEDKLWHRRQNTSNRFRRVGIRTLRILIALARDLMRGELNLRAMSLVFTTILSLVPLIAVSFSVLKGFGVHEELQPMLLQFFQFLGPDSSVQLTNTLIGFVDNTSVRVLGLLGVTFLFYTVISLIQKVEEAFNYAWHIQKSRTILRKVSDYLSVLLIGPLLIVTGLAMSANLASSDLFQRVVQFGPLAYLYQFALLFIPYILVSLAFTFVFSFVPNTHVRVKSALIGGFIAGVLWQTTGWGFASMVVASSKYEAIYSGFAIVIFFVVWIYINWLIIIFGARISFYIQNPEYLRIDFFNHTLSRKAEDELCLALLTSIATAFETNQSAPQINTLSDQLNVPEFILEPMVNRLARHHYISQLDNQAYVPARPLAQIKLVDILHTLYQDGDSLDIPLLASAEQLIHKLVVDPEMTLSQLVEHPAHQST